MGTVARAEVGGKEKKEKRKQKIIIVSIKKLHCESFEATCLLVFTYREDAFASAAAALTRCTRSSSQHKSTNEEHFCHFFKSMGCSQLLNIKKYICSGTTFDQDKLFYSCMTMDNWCVTERDCLLAREKFGSPTYLYSEDAIRKQAKTVTEGLDAPFGLTVR